MKGRFSSVEGRNEPFVLEPTPSGKFDEDGDCA